MPTLNAMLIIAVVYAIGDLVSNKTKAVLSMMFVAAVIFLVGFWVGIPVTLFEDSKLVPVAMAIISVLMIHMGSMIKLKDLKDEWKTVIVAVAALLGLAVALYFLAAPLVGRAMSIISIGPISGGVVATMIVSEGVKAKGLEPSMAVFATLLLVLQSFIGLPIASNALKLATRKMLVDFRANATGKAGEPAKAANDPETPTFRLIPALPKGLQTPFILLTKAFFAGWLAVAVAGLTKNVIHPYVMALAFGIILYEIGFIEYKILDKANASGLALFMLLVPIFMNLTKATPAMVVSLIFPMIVTFLISVSGIVIISLALSRILRYSWQLCLAIGVTCMFGFPGTYIISQEVAESQASTPEEKAYLLSVILPKMLVAGFATVSIGSVFLAGFVVKLL